MQEQDSELLPDPRLTMPMSDPYQIEGREGFRNLGYLVRDTHRVLRRLMRARIAKFGVTVAMWPPLHALWQQDGLTQNEVAQRVRLEKASVGATLFKMERLGLIERRPSPHDGRARLVFLTPKASALKKDMLSMTAGINQEVLTALTPDEAEQLIGLLFRVRAVAHQRAEETLTRDADWPSGSDDEGEME